MQTRYLDATKSERESPHDLSWWLDSSIPLPGGFRIGLDGIIGLIPGLGDAIGGGLSTWILYQAYQHNVPRMVLLRMLINVVIDVVLGAIPIVGDIFDLFWKANLRNARLLENYRRAPVATYRRSVVFSVAVFVAIVVAASLVMFGIIALVAFVWNLALQPRV